MNPELIFSIVNTTALVSWLILVFLPRWSVTRIAIINGAIPLLLSAAYLIIVTVFFGSAEGGFDSLENVMKLFTEPWVALAGWIHYLAFDLFVGAWEVNDAQTLGISHVLVIPCLILTFLFGPFGFLLYTILRTVYKARTKEAI